MAITWPSRLTVMFQLAPPAGTCGMTGVLGGSVNVRPVCPSFTAGRSGTTRATPPASTCTRSAAWRAAMCRPSGPGPAGRLTEKTSLLTVTSWPASTVPADAVMGGTVMAGS